MTEYPVGNENEPPSTSRLLINWKATTMFVLSTNMSDIFNLSCITVLLIFGTFKLLTSIFKQLICIWHFGVFKIVMWPVSKLFNIALTLAKIRIKCFLLTFGDILGYFWVIFDVKYRDNAHIMDFGANLALEKVCVCNLIISICLYFSLRLLVLQTSCIGLDFRRPRRPIDCSLEKCSPNSSLTRALAFCPSKNGNR